MFPFGTISQGHCGCFLMWFPLFIQHLLDNIGAASQLCCHIGSRTMERATTTEVKRKKLQCVAAQTESDIHENVGFIKVWCCHLATLNTTCIQPF